MPPCVKYVSKRKRKVEFYILKVLKYKPNTVLKYFFAGFLLGGGGGQRQPPLACRLMTVDFSEVSYGPLIHQAVLADYLNGPRSY
jgi:hypothetical protein